MLRAIDDFPSFFHPEGDCPLIIDCGANIGVSVLEWKYRWPMARVICFEPDPFAFRLLEMNIERNDLPGVRCIQAAISGFDGPAIMHGNLGHGADSRGNSLQPAWGRRPRSGAVEVACKRLGPYLTPEPVAFLKLDIEGCEEAALRDAGPALESVAAAYVEVHETDELRDANSATRVASLLQQAGFQVEFESRYGPHALPAELRHWQRQVNARQTQLLCWRDEDRDE